MQVLYSVGIIIADACAFVKHRNKKIFPAAHKKGKREQIKRKFPQEVLEDVDSLVAARVAARVRGSVPCGGLGSRTRLAESRSGFGGGVRRVRGRGQRQRGCGGRRRLCRVRRFGIRPGVRAGARGYPPRVPLSVVRSRGERGRTEGAPEEGHAPKEEGAAGGASPAGAERAENGSSPRGRGTANGGSAFGSVTGRARIEAEADSVQLYVSVEAAGGDMAEALRRSEQLASAAKEAFAPYGSASETDVCAFPAPGTGYTAVRSLCLTAERAAEVEAAREALAGAGVTHFGGVSYRSKDEAALRRQALQQAAEDARAKAEALGLDADTLCLREVYCTVYGGPGGVVAEAEVRAFPAAAREARA